MLLTGLMKEIEGRARRSAGMRKNIRAAKSHARETGEVYVPPPLQPRLNPEERLDFERFILPNIKGLPDYDKISKYMPIVEDFFSTRLRIRNNPDTSASEIKKFMEEHPELKNGRTDVLNPAFKLITGRMTQATNIQKQASRR